MLQRLGTMRGDKLKLCVLQAGFVNSKYDVCTVQIHQMNGSSLHTQTNSVLGPGLKKHFVILVVRGINCQGQCESPGKSNREQETPTGNLSSAFLEKFSVV